MKIVKTSNELKAVLGNWKSDNPTGVVGLIPTMGALHEGHMTLLAAARETCDLVVVSVFVNPTQFNDAKDLERYPRTEEADAAMLASHQCDIMFLPAVNDMYPPNDSPYEIDLKGLDKVMEGEFRPGHFKGVCNIVEKLFRIVEPGKAYFGIKDFQQVAVISHMVKVRNLPVEIVPCPIKRNNGGLALSSRNALLSEKEKEAARIINWMLRIGKQLVSEGKPLDIVRENMLSVFNLGELELEYLEIVDNTTLQPAVSTDSKISACTAAYCGKVRLIDNIQLN